eukprot:9482826-Pyramimonas_sp.AAC.1
MRGRGRTIGDGEGVEEEEKKQGGKGSVWPESLRMLNVSAAAPGRNWATKTQRCFKTQSDSRVSRGPTGRPAARRVETRALSSQPYSCNLRVKVTPH